MTDRERASLRSRLAKKDLLVAPGVFDGISAKIADQMGFEALYMTGYGTVASHLGLPTPASLLTRIWSAALRSSPTARARR